MQHVPVVSKTWRFLRKRVKDQGCGTADRGYRTDGTLTGCQSNVLKVHAERPFRVGEWATGVAVIIRKLRPLTRLHKRQQFGNHQIRVRQERQIPRIRNAVQRDLFGVARGKGFDRVVA